MTTTNKLEAYNKRIDCAANGLDWYVKRPLRWRGKDYFVIGISDVYGLLYETADDVIDRYNSNNPETVLSWEKHGLTYMKITVLTPEEHAKVVRNGYMMIGFIILSIIAAYFGMKG